MQISPKHILLFCVCFSVFSCTRIFGYTPDAATSVEANQFVNLVQKKLASYPANKAEKYTAMIHAKMLSIQNKLINKTHQDALKKNALQEMIRRKLFPDSFDTSDVIFDDGVGAIWTHASQGFGILYNPVATPTIGALSAGTKNILVNGSYFSRKDGAQYHSGLLWSHGVLWSEMISNDPQITHIVCLDSHKNMTFWPNNSYFDGLMDACDTAFQAGPMIYRLEEGIIGQNLAPKNYIGKAHNRTMMVLFEKNGAQDLWFLTLIKPSTLSNVRDVVLRESRFRGEYDTLHIFNLDGGSSVAHRNPDHPELNFGSSKALPVVFEIYK